MVLKDRKRTQNEAIKTAKCDLQRKSVNLGKVLLKTSYRENAKNLPERVSVDRLSESRMEAEIEREYSVGKLTSGAEKRRIGRALKGFSRFSEIKG